MDDRGYYHCQLAMDPTQIVWNFLEIAKPYFKIVGSSMNNGSLEEQHYHLGSQIWLQCEVSKAPLHDVRVQWVFIPGNKDQNSKPIILNEDTVRGGIEIQSWRLNENIVISNLTLHNAGARDQGNYTCSLPHKLAVLGNFSVSVHILEHGLPGLPVQSKAPTLTCVFITTYVSLNLVISISNHIFEKRL